MKPDATVTADAQTPIARLAADLLAATGCRREPYIARVNLPQRHAERLGPVRPHDKRYLAETVAEGCCRRRIPLETTIP